MSSDVVALPLGTADPRCGAHRHGFVRPRSSHGTHGAWPKAARGASEGRTAAELGLRPLQNVFAVTATASGAAEQPADSSAHRRHSLWRPGSFGCSSRSRSGHFLCSGPCLTKSVWPPRQHCAPCPAAHVVTMTSLCSSPAPSFVFFALWWCVFGAPFDPCPHPACAIV